MNPFPELSSNKSYYTQKTRAITFLTGKWLYCDPPWIWHTDTPWNINDTVAISFLSSRQGLQLLKRFHDSRVAYSLNICFSSQFDNASKLTWVHINKKLNWTTPWIYIDLCLPYYVSTIQHVQNNRKKYTCLTSDSHAVNSGRLLLQNTLHS